MRKSKWTYELIAVAVLICIVGGVCWWQVTKDQRAAGAQYEQLVNFASRQQVEIAIIKQAAELQQLRAAIQKAQQLAPLFPQATE